MSAREGRIWGQSSQFKTNSINKIHEKADRQALVPGGEELLGLSLAGLEGAHDPQL